MGSAKAREKGNRFSGSSYQDLKLPNKNDERFAGREMLAEVNRPSGLLRSQTPTKRDALAGVLRNSLPSGAPAPSWALASAQASQAPAARPQSQPTTKPAGSDGKGPKITYKPSKPSVPPMRSETQATVERALREAGITSIKISSTQEGSFADKKRVHDIDSNHYDRPGKVGTSADISEIDGRPVSTYSTDPYVKQKVDALQQALDRQGAHENFGPSRVARDGRPVPERTPQEKAKAKSLREGHHDHIHIDPPRRKSGQKP